MTLDLGLQKEGEKALLQGIEQRPCAGANRRSPGRSSRSTRATGRCSRSAPIRRFDPNKFAKPLTKAEYAALEGKAAARLAAKNRRRR